MKYRRRDEVTARQIHSPCEFTLDGTELHARAGDWLVISESVVHRTVSAAQFPDNYEHVTNDRYRHVGTVTARQVPTQETVLTPEGASTAEPGDWIVTDEDGSSWPVSNDAFRSTYAAIGE